MIHVHVLLNNLHDWMLLCILGGYIYLSMRSQEKNQCINEDMFYKLTNGMHGGWIWQPNWGRWALILLHSAFWVVDLVTYLWSRAERMYCNAFFDMLTKRNNGNSKWIKIPNIHNLILMHIGDDELQAAIILKYSWTRYCSYYFILFASFHLFITLWLMIIWLTDHHINLDIISCINIYAHLWFSYSTLLSQNTENARKARLWRHNNDDVIKSD